MLELLNEVFSVMRCNRMRLLLTGFSIGWGLFILIVIVGSGNGVTRGIAESFHSDTICTLYLTHGRTSIAWHGKNPLRKIELHASDADALRNAFPHEVREVLIENQSPPVNVSVASRSIKVPLYGCDIGYYRYKLMNIVSGRDFTDVDMKHQNRVCLLGQQSVDILFGKDADAIGRSVFANGISFRVVGVYDSSNGHASGHNVYVPYTTGETLFAPDGMLREMIVVAENVSNNEQLDVFRKKIYGAIAERLDFNPDDKMALSCKCYSEEFFKLVTILDMVRIFIWIVGLATLISGIVGISNIMIIGVRERTREFGIRMAMGASDLSIIRMVLMESVIVTFFFGYIGMMLGIGLTQSVAWVLKETGGVTFFQNPTIDFSMLIVSTLLIMAAGLLAGFFPARQAVRMKLVESLNS